MLLVCVLWSLGLGEEGWDKNAGNAIAFGWWVAMLYKPAMQARAEAHPLQDLAWLSSDER